MGVTMADVVANQPVCSCLLWAVAVTSDSFHRTISSYSVYLQGKPQTGMEQVLDVSTCPYHIVVFLPYKAPSFTCYFLNPLLLTSDPWICLCLLS